MPERSAFGYPIRDPFPGELKFFEGNPTVSGMAAEDGAIILNPFAPLNPRERNAVILNEATRLLLKETGVPQFEITDQQRKFFADLADRGIPGERSEDDIRATLLGRIISGDPSAGDVTDDQRRVAGAIVKRLQSLRSRDGAQ